MSTKILLTILAGLAFGLAITFSGCSGSNTDNPKAESISDAVIDDVVETTFADAEADPIDASYAVDSNAGPTQVTLDASMNLPEGPGVYDMIVKDNIIYAIVDEGILVHDLCDGKNRVVALDEPVGAIIELDEKILVGADNLYTLDGDVLSSDNYRLDLPGSVTALHRRGIDLYIGTTGGLYQLSIGGIRELAQNIHVSAITTDVHGSVWVGTAGDGLYRWDGERFQKRFLQRDSTLFDNVSALAYNHEHLYLGTDRGFFIFDGGRWESYDLADGLPSEVITSINARDWVIKVGTANGPATFFNNEFKPMTKFTGVAVTRMEKNEGRTIAATSNAGLLMSSGGLVTALYDERTKPAPMAQEDTW